MMKLIGYVGTRDLPAIAEEDIRCLDVINIAFGQVQDARMVWEGQSSRPALDRIRRVHPGVKILLSVGGWGADGFSQAALTAQGRESMAESAAALVAEYGLDGIDIDWEYPGMALAGIGAHAKDRENFTLLLKAVRERLDTAGSGYMLTIAAGGDSYFTRQTNMKEAAVFLDYVQLMTYDLQGGFQKVTGHHAALYPGNCSLFDACADKAVKAFLEAGVPAEKLVIGVPFYSRKWEGVKGGAPGPGQEAETVGGYGPDYGSLTADYINKNGFIRYWDEEALSPYLFDGSTFISYEDEESMAYKVRYAGEKGLGGIMYWEYRCDGTGTLTGFLRRELDRSLCAGAVQERDRILCSGLNQEQDRILCPGLNQERDRSLCPGTDQEPEANQVREAAHEGN